MRFLSADVIFPIYTEPISNGILAVSANGTINDVLLPDDVNAPEPSRVERLEGALCPGFINAHCHLELSHMKGVIAENTGLPKFIIEIVNKRDENAEMKMEAMRLADAEMWRNGIQAVGDICNTADTLETKQSSRIKYHSFVEVFSFDPAKANVVLKEGIRVAGLYQQADLRASIVPHAPYSVSEQLFAGIASQQSRFSGPISIHNQETESEDEMFVSGTGALVETFKGFGVDFTNFNPQKRSALHYALPQLPKNENVILIHNTCSKPEEFDYVDSLRKDVFWCTCAQANKYIENRIPNLSMWLEKQAKICVGTDSLASNHQLSILEELKLIQANYPEFKLAQLLKMATLNGAKALNMDKEKGSFLKGKLPGILWLKNVNLNEGILRETSSIQRIV
ncbi:MAG: amidohydrolase family protein [Flavobacteriales bacterium]|nr:amidohydrolase family protein [Flavobacteriales bacterium]